MAKAGEEVIAEDDIDVMMIWEAVEAESKRRIEADSTAPLAEVVSGRSSLT